MLSMKTIWNLHCQVNIYGPIGPIEKDYTVIIIYQVYIIKNNENKYSTVNKHTYGTHNNNNYNYYYNK